MSRGPSDGAAGAVRFELANVGAHSVWTQAGWDRGFLVLRDAAGQRIATGHGTVCGPRMCGEPAEPCAAEPAPPYTVELRAGDALTSRWDGVRLEHDGDEACYREVAAAPGPYTAEFCWGLDPGDEPAAGADEGQYLEGFRCETREFTLGEDELVRVEVSGEPPRAPVTFVVEDDLGLGEADPLLLSSTSELDPCVFAWVTVADARGPLALATGACGLALCSTGAATEGPCAADACVPPPRVAVDSRGSVSFEWSGEHVVTTGSPHGAGECFDREYGHGAALTATVCPAPSLKENCALSRCVTKPFTLGVDREVRFLASDFMECLPD